MTDLAPILTRFAAALVDQDQARVLVEPQQRGEGFWFGGGDVVRDVDGSYWLCGRYRNHGDSRTGTGAGERGLELALFRAGSPLGPWEKACSWSKAELARDGIEVVSIEGASLRLGPAGAELFVSTEKARAFPAPLRDFQKPGTGWWDIDLVTAPTIEDLKAAPVRPCVGSDEGATLHVKDPVAIDHPRVAGGSALIFCSHPFSWASSNTGLAAPSAGAGSSFEIETFELLPRGPVWDVAATRVTDRLPVPPLGRLAVAPRVSLYFYDGAECLRALDENPAAVKRPRGYSCEEIGGLAFGRDDAFPALQRLSLDAPLFTSPRGTGCSRYVSTLVTDEGVLATWQQSQDDLSQPLVGHFLPMEEVERLLRAEF